jgi:hypothetical protein
MRRYQPGDGWEGCAAGDRSDTPADGTQPAIQQREVKVECRGLTWCFPVPIYKGEDFRNCRKPVKAR